MLAAVRARVPDLRQKVVYELAARGPIHDFLRAQAGRLVCSEYLEGTVPGASVDGVQSQDVQALTYPSASFDLCVCTEVFEHVPDDGRGFSELHRVLRNGGQLFLTVPLHDFAVTRERAKLVAGRLVHLLESEYHDDPLRGPGTALVFRDYGADLDERLRAAGFQDIGRIRPGGNTLWGFGRTIIVATA